MSAPIAKDHEFIRQFEMTYPILLQVLAEAQSQEPNPVLAHTFEMDSWITRAYCAVWGLNKLADIWIPSVFEGETRQEGEEYSLRYRKGLAIGDIVLSSSGKMSAVQFSDFVLEQAKTEKASLLASNPSLRIEVGHARSLPCGPPATLNPDDHLGHYLKELLVHLQANDLNEATPAAQGEQQVSRF
jgi:hypothetical protein